MIKLIENQSEIGEGTRGAGLGVGALKVVSQTIEDGFFGNYETINIIDENNLLNYPTPYNFAKRIDGLVKIYDRTCEAISKVIKEGDFPLVLSGDHACAGGTIAGLKKAYPTKRIGVVWIDAHADVHTPYTTPSGNIHGMPVATALNEDNLHAKINDLNPETAKLWDKLKQTGGIAPKVNTEDLVYIAVRDTEKPEDDFINNHQIKNYSVDEIRTKGLQNIINDVKSRLKNCDFIYVSFDVDAMDCILVSKGTGTPVEHGLTPQEAEYLLMELAKWKKTACIEFVEINPCLDDKINKMAETAYALLKMVAKTIDSRK